MESSGFALLGARYAEPRQQSAFYGDDNWSAFAIEGRPDPPQGQQQQAAIRAVSSEYFATMKIPHRKGRFFTNADARIALPLLRWFQQQPHPQHFDQPQPAPAAIINQTVDPLIALRYE